MITNFLHYHLRERTTGDGYKRPKLNTAMVLRTQNVSTVDIKGKSGAVPDTIKKRVARWIKL